ncbi:MAG: hypothetical protein COW30_00795 [Rhodospirillales bacterium CG15_BIG_FIL_POST_REV_8_21_14_020_66_15]|nr:MAG: hypothetical protein COW30_00795 [Rhodospirillales bacterium CG15_BIG_FIL_POST_REV_8_21_14_020_66_15]
MKERLSAAVSWGDTGRRLNDIAERHEDSFVNLANRFDIGDWDWWESRNLAERGPLSSTFTVECCRLILFGDCLERGGSHLFIVEVHDLADILLAEARRRGVPVRWRGPGAVRRRAERAATQGIAFLRFARAALRRAARLRRLRVLRRRHPIDWDRLRACDVLFAAWSAPDDFPDRGPRDVAHYMGALPREARAAGITAGYVALPLDWIYDADEIHRNAVASAEAAMVADDAVTTGALWRVAADAVRLRAGPKPDMAIGGQPLGTVARMVLARERFDWRAVTARLMAEIGPFLARHGCRPGAVCHVYENQTWEKGLRAGLRRALPDTRVAGVHQSPFSKMYLNMLPSQAEVAKGRWPDVVFTHGARSRRQLTSTGAPENRVIDAGLFRQGSFILNRVPGTGTHRRLVVATGVDFQECCELVAKAAAAAGDDWELAVNFHPSTAPSFRDGIRRFLETRGLTGPRVTFVDHSVADLLKNGADAILYTDTNAAFEGVSTGARAINVERDSAFSFDKLPDGLSRRLYTAAEIRSALGEIADDGAWPGPSEVEAALADCFSAADAAKVVAALGRAEKNASPTFSQTDKVMER